MIIHYIYLLIIALLALECWRLRRRGDRLRAQYFTCSDGYGKLMQEIRAILGCPNSTREQLIIAVKLASAKSGELKRVEQSLDGFRMNHRDVGGVAERVTLLRNIARRLEREN